jgi:hypothetical protein
MHTDRLSFCELARCLEITEADCRFLVDAARLPFVNDCGNLFISLHDLSQWKSSAKAILGDY